MEATATCSVTTCEGRIKAKGLCKLHYQRLRRTGSTETTRFTPKPCSVPECTRRHLALGMCSLHYERFRNHGDPLKTLPNAATAGSSNPKWRGDNIGYTAAHDRVRDQRGSARNHTCSKCAKRADQWGYDHADPKELVAVVRRRGKEESMPYSPDPAHYLPFCRRCHWEFDHPSGSRKGWRDASAA